MSVTRIEEARMDRHAHALYRTRRRGIVLLSALLVLAVLASPAGGASTAPDRECVPGVDGCIPTPEQCASGNFNGQWEGPRPGAAAVCVGGGGHVAHYVGGDPSIPCGAVIEADVVVAGGWADPNRCFVPPTEPGPGVTGSRYLPEVRSRRGVVVAESGVAASVGRGILAEGGNAIDAAVAAVFAYGVARPENCGIGGRGFLLYRAANGASAALDFYAAAPAAIRPDSMQGLGIDDAEAGHRTVAVPGVVAGMASAARRLGTMPLARLIAPAERLARDGVRVTPEQADAYAYQVYPSPFDAAIAALPSDPVPGKTNIAKLRAFPEAANIYLQEGVLPYPAGGRLVQREYANSLALIMREGPGAFYRGRIARLIDAEMRRSQTSPHPGGRGLLTYTDLVSYRPIWRRPLSMAYRGTTVLGTPPPSSAVMTMEMLAILEGFDLRGAGHSSADHVHLVAEAEKLARADRDAYIADPAFERVPSGVLLGRRYAASRRALIDRSRAGAFQPGAIRGFSPSAAPERKGAHTTHVSVVDRWGNAAAVTCSLGPAFGSGVVAPGTGFLLAATNHYFSDPGHINEAEPGKRPTTAQSPLIVVRGGTPILVAGGAGSETIPPGVAQMAIDVVDFGMKLGRAIDAARFHEHECCDLFIEDARVPPGSIGELERRGHSIVRLGEYWVLPWLQIAGIDPRSRERVGASDPRGEYGAATT